MNLKTYQANTMAEVLALLRKDLGRDAVILNTRTVRKGGILGFRARNVVEVTATSGVQVLHPEQRKKLLKAEAQPRAAGSESAGPVVAAGVGVPVDHLKQELALVRRMVQELLDQNHRQRHPSVPQELFGTYSGLINQQVSQELANQVIDQVKSALTPEQLHDAKAVRSVLAGCLEKMLPPAQPIAIDRKGRSKIIALVGPTGVGKTTTIAKLAANFKLRENRSVGLITIDTYRIAAVDQLRTYAGILNVPLAVVLTPEELRDALRKMKHLDLVLIDTAGRSQNDELKLRELKSFLSVVHPDEIHLVLSTTASQSCLMSAIQRFAGLNVDRVIFTKLDEAVGLGILLNVMKKVDRAVSYITTGQNVPDDIEPGTAQTLARHLLDPRHWSEESAPISAIASTGVNIA